MATFVVWIRDQDVIIGPYTRLSTAEMRRDQLFAKGIGCVVVATISDSHYFGKPVGNHYKREA